MPKLTYVVEVNCEENGFEYLQTVAKLFRIVTEELQSWAFAGESVSTSEIEVDTHSRKVYDHDLEGKDQFGL